MRLGSRSLQRRAGEEAIVHNQVAACSKALGGFARTGGADTSGLEGQYREFRFEVKHKGKLLERELVLGRFPGQSCHMKNAAERVTVKAHSQ